MLNKTPDGSLVDDTGRVILFSVERFVRDIACGNCCFICGADRGEATFNDEHVLPDWILRKHALHSRTINLPNATQVRYGQYKIPCCKSCNSTLADTFETPISSIVGGGYHKVIEYVQENGPWRIFAWLALIFLKTHLKDLALRLERDHRKGDSRIGDLYAWEELHHIHCIARSFFSGAKIDEGVLGSCCILPVKPSLSYDAFDYHDLHDARTILLSLGTTCFIAVLNDAGIASHCFRDQLQRIDGPLSPVQLLEVMSYLAHINVRLKTRPTFVSKITVDDRYHISAHVPRVVELESGGREVYGEIFYHCTAHWLVAFRNPSIDAIREQVRAGDYTFLFDANGRFLDNSMEPVEETR